jgi:hypothetical protein
MEKDHLQLLAEGHGAIIERFDRVDARFDRLEGRLDRLAVEMRCLRSGGGADLFVARRRR